MAKIKHNNEVIFKGTSYKKGIYFNKTVICINGIDCLEEDLNKYTEIKDKRSIQTKINFRKYPNKFQDLIKVFEIWRNRATSVKLAERDKMRGLNCG